MGQSAHCRPFKGPTGRSDSDRRGWDCLQSPRERGAGSRERGAMTHRGELRITDSPEGGRHPSRWCAIPTMMGHVGSWAHVGIGMSARNARPRITRPAGAPPTQWREKSLRSRLASDSPRGSETCCWVHVFALL